MKRLISAVVASAIAFLGFIGASNAEDGSHVVANPSFEQADANGRSRNRSDVADIRGRLDASSPAAFERARNSCGSEFGRARRDVVDC